MARRLLAFLLLLSVLLPATATAATPTGAREERFFGAVQAIRNPSRAAEAGVQWERIIFPWSLIQKDGPDAWDWDAGYYTDAQIDDEINRGREVVGIAIYTPQWASTTPVTGRPPNVPANLYLPFDDPRNHWGQFMYRLAQHERGKIDAWMIWNEPDMYSDEIKYTWDGSVQDMYQLIKVAYLAVKKANPDATVVLPGLTYWWDHESGRELYLKRLLDVAAADPTARANNWYFDVANLHLYGSPLNAYAAPILFQKTLAAYGLDKPIWITEANIVPYDDPLSPLSPVPFRASMDQQAAYIIQAFALARAAGVEKMSVYKMVDEAPEGPGELFGLVRNDGSVRPAFAALQAATKWLADPLSVTYTWDGAAETPTPAQVDALVYSNDRKSQFVWQGAINRVTLDRRADRVTVVWNASQRPATASIPAVAKSAMVVNKVGQVSGELIAHNGVYTLDLPAGSDATDPRYPDLNLVGGDPFILVEKQTPIPESVDAPIQVVWPRDGDPGQASRANVTAVLLDPGTTQAVPCRWDPTVNLVASVDGGPGKTIGTGARRMVTDNGITYPVWDFNNVDVTAARGGKEMDLWIEVDGASENSPHWRYSDRDTPPPTWQQRPAVGCAR